MNKQEKPVVPQVVADWYEEHKDNFEYSIQCLCVQGCEPKRQIDTWFDNDDNKPIETLVMMKLFGYEVEKEKLYRVCIADNLVINDTLTQNKDSGIFSFSIGDDSESELFTKTKLEQSGFGWVFDCNGMKVEEVEWKE